MKIVKDQSFADSICDLRTRKIKAVFFQQVNDLLDWNAISKIIDDGYSKGKSAVGTAAYDGLLLFKMCLLQTWYGLSDYEVEDRINDSISFSYFCGLTIEQTAPDHSTLSRFRSRLTKSGVYDHLFKEINRQLEKREIIVKSGAIVDASVVDTPRKPKGKPSHQLPDDITDKEVITDKENELPSPTSKSVSAGTDLEAAWVKKRGKLRYGYKKHYVTDLEGLVIGVHTTAANVHEITNLEEVLATADLPIGIPVKADKGYKSKKNDTLLIDKKLKNHLLKKATKGKPLSARAKQFNKGVGKIRFKVERTFGGIRRWFGGGVARYIGHAKMHTQNLMEAVCYNLYRSPGIVMSNSIQSAKK